LAETAAGELTDTLLECQLNISQHAEVTHKGHVHLDWFKIDANDFEVNISSALSQIYLRACLHACSESQRDNLEHKLSLQCTHYPDMKSFW